MCERRPAASLQRLLTIAAMLPRDTQRLPHTSCVQVDGGWSGSCPKDAALRGRLESEPLAAQVSHTVRLAGFILCSICFWQRVCGQETEEHRLSSISTMVSRTCADGERLKTLEGESRFQPRADIPRKLGQTRKAS